MLKYFFQITRQNWLKRTKQTELQICHGDRPLDLALQNHTKTSRDPIYKISYDNLTIILR